MLGIYLIHDNDYIRPIIWQKIYPNIDYINNPYIHSIVKISLVFIGCLVIDLVKSGTIGYIFRKTCSKKLERINQKATNWIPYKLKVKYIEIINDSAR